MASVTTTDLFTSKSAMDATTPAAGTGTIGFVMVNGKAVAYVYLTTASGAPANGWYRTSGL